MRSFGSYSNFIRQREQQAQAQTSPGIMVPKFILTGNKEAKEEEAKEETGKEELQAGKQGEAAAEEQNFTK
jgi:hypothetical protein